jgi:hypothetical protein
MFKKGFPGPKVGCPGVKLSDIYSDIVRVAPL